MSIRIHVLPEKSNLTHTTSIDEVLYLSDDASGFAAAFPATCIRHDAEGTEVVASAHNCNEGQRTADDLGFELFVCLCRRDARQLIGGAGFIADAVDELGKIAVVIRPENKIDGQAHSEKIFAEILRHTTEDTDYKPGITLFQIRERLQPTVYALMCLLAHGTGIEQNDAGLFFTTYNTVAVIFEKQAHDTRIIFVHLASVGFDKDVAVEVMALFALIAQDTRLKGWLLHRGQKKPFVLRRKPIFMPECMPSRPRIDKSLNIEEITYLFQFLEEPLTSYDCGTLCKDQYKGVPYCCSSEHAVPLLYKAEFTYLKSLGDLWHEWKPITADDKELKKSESKDQIFCECKGVAHCVREQRSISCRTFPLEPYIDRRGVFVGLTFLQEFTGKDPDTGKIKCPLTRKAKDIRQEAIDSHFMFWEKIMLRRSEEYETYVDTSKKLRRDRDRSGRTFTVLLPSHLKDSKLVRQYM